MLKLGTILMVFVLLLTASFSFAQNKTVKTQTASSIQMGCASKPKIIKNQANGSPIPLILLSALQPVALPSEKRAWILQIVSRGGFVGNGLGDLMITSDGKVTCSKSANPPCNERLSPKSLHSLVRVVASAQPNLWNQSSVSKCLDCYVTMVVFYRRESDGCEKRYIAYWDDTTQARVLPDVKLIFEKALTLTASKK